MYKRITELPANSESLAVPELAGLSKVWLDRKIEVEQWRVYPEFLEKLQREWAIETGNIERLYTLDQGITEILIEQGIDAALIAHKGGLQREHAELVKNFIDDQKAVVDGLFAFIKSDQPLTEHYIKAMHAQFTAHQNYTEARTMAGQIVRIPIIKGDYKKLPNNPRRVNGNLHEYCPPEFVRDEMEQLIQWYHAIEAKTPPEILAAWLHHRFTQIHPFQDGNGRVARTLASLVFLRAGLFPLVIRESDRKKYILALENADEGQLSNLVQLFANRQRAKILEAIELELDSQPGQNVDEIIDYALQKLTEAKITQNDRVKQVTLLATRLQTIALERFKEIDSRLNEKLKEATPSNQLTSYRSRVSFGDNTRENMPSVYNRSINIAREFKIRLAQESYQAWVSLKIHSKTDFELFLHFNGIGLRSHGIIVAVAGTVQGLSINETGLEPEYPYPQSVSEDFFQCNYAESIETAESRFHDWLENAITSALKEWARSLQT